MKKLEDIKEIINDILRMFIKVLTCVFLITGIISYTTEIEESNLDKIKYCHSCGVDLLKK